MKKILIIGSGPRGLSVLERISAILESGSQVEALEIIIVDKNSIGNGRIWDNQQSKSYIMNTLATEISAFSGHGPVHGAKPGYGPSFAEWWQTNYTDVSTYQGFAPRAYYGEYLKFVFDVIRDNLSTNVIITALQDEVIDIDVNSGQCKVYMKESESITCDVIVIATGHAENSYVGKFKELESHAYSDSGAKFIGANSSASIDYSEIIASDNVGVVGLGLSFFDVISELTEGRGGKFTYSEGGECSYIPSGKEPNLICGSRSGLPILARGKNEKSKNYKHTHRILTKNRIETLKSKNKINFELDIWPLIEAEVNLTYFETLINNSVSHSASQYFVQDIVKNSVDCSNEISLRASYYLNEKVESLVLKDLARPFDNKIYSSEEHWENELISLIMNDINAAEIGNVSSPLKSALDVLRHSRDQIRLAVDFGGLTPESHKEFIYKYVPIMNLLCAGPPLFRVKQLIALIKSGIVTVSPPKIKIDKSADGYNFSSDCIDSFSKRVNVLIDARIPSTNLYLDKSLLTCNLLKKGVFTSFVNTDSAGRFFDTAGLNVTQKPYNPIDINGRVVDCMFALGIPTEHTRWFMQSGSSRPNHWIDFMIDADAIANAVLSIVQRKKIAA